MDQMRGGGWRKEKMFKRLRDESTYGVFSINRRRTRNPWCTQVLEKAGRAWTKEVIWGFSGRKGTWMLFGGQGLAGQRILPLPLKFHSFFQLCTRAGLKPRWISCQQSLTPSLPAKEKERVERKKPLGSELQLPQI